MHLGAEETMHVRGPFTDNSNKVQTVNKNNVKFFPTLIKHIYDCDLYTYE